MSIAVPADVQEMLHFGRGRNVEHIRVNDDWLVIRLGRIIASIDRLAFALVDLQLLDNWLDVAFRRGRLNNQLHWPGRGTRDVAMTYGSLAK